MRSIYSGARLAGFAILFLTGLSVSSVARADPADTLVLILHYDTYYKNISEIALSQSLQRLKEKGLTDNKLSDATSALNVEVENYKKVFLGKMADAYRSRFSADEINSLIAFYKSPLGIKAGANQKSIQDYLATATRDAGIYVGVSAAQFAQ
ncbi:DUF2059 domain-containing protein [Mesorhizobium comanense]|uniref:DUF2059 domain-containing protein n=1 Tax=Mesorhizobium comanense TaxID=2502215 RepID=UPI001484FF5A|nr:DUF2059 domain-containing protein [Mesorhizobium comanense]